MKDQRSPKTSIEDTPSCMFANIKEAADLQLVKPFSKSPKAEPCQEHP